MGGEERRGEGIGDARWYGWVWEVDGADLLVFLTGPTGWIEMRWRKVWAEVSEVVERVRLG